MRLVTIHSALNAADAQLVFARLEAAGFHPFLANESAPFYLPGLSHAASIQVQLPEDEVLEARAFLTDDPGKSQ